MSSPNNLSKNADQCVMCGLCLPHCPTYQVSQHEAESPRGRISLVKAYAEGHLTASTSLETHLQSCTGCMKCQQVCPANAPYQDIIDSGRYLYRSQLKMSARLLQIASITLMTRQWGHRVLSLLSSAANFAPAKNRFARLLRRVNKSKPASPITTKQQSVIVLPGCTGSLFDQQTLDSIIKILCQLHIGVTVPDKLLCCGALAQHSGYPQMAKKQAAATNHYLSNQQATEFISFASGCGRQLNDHVASDRLEHKDIISWLAKSTNIEPLKFEPLTQRVLIHMPCTLKDDDRHNVIKLLNLIPNIHLLEFDDEISCCGAGGMQLMSPETSNRALLDSKINTIRTIQPDIIVSSNIGCSLNLQLGLQDTGLDINVIHPVTLLAQQLKH